MDYPGPMLGQGLRLDAAGYPGCGHPGPAGEMGLPDKIRGGGGVEDVSMLPKGGLQVRAQTAPDRSQKLRARS